jgi:subtilase family serine protease
LIVFYLMRGSIMKLTAPSALLGLTMFGMNISPSPLFAAEKAVLQGQVAAAKMVDFEVYIPLQNQAGLSTEIAALNDPTSATYHKWLTPAEFDERYGATPAQLAAIRSHFASYGLTATKLSGHRLHVSGPANGVEQALSTRLATGTFKNGRAMPVATKEIVRPDAMVQVGAVVVGLSGTIHMKTHSRIASVKPVSVAPDNRYSTAGGYWFTDLKQAYSFPSYQTYAGTGVTIATLVDGAYSPSDMAKYFTHETLATPQFSEVNVDGGAPFNDDSFETNLDFQQAGGMAPNASIIHYNIPDLSDQSIIDGLDQIIKDNKADVVSMSFGGPEVYYTAALNDGVDFTYLIKMEDAIMAQGNAQGITFVASSGDSGALSAVPLNCFDGPTPASCGTFFASAEFPASSPHVTGVGGTNLATTYDGITRNSAYVSEEAYADPLASDIFYGTTATGGYWGSGGGDSVIFSRPDYQALVTTGNKSFRTVPDVAYHMGGCPGGSQSPCNPADSFVYEVYNNLYYGAIGTSAAAPDFAGLVALYNQRNGSRSGNINSFIYKLAVLQKLGAANVFHQGIPGFNGLYSGTATGYNRVLGNGTVNAVNFLLAPTNPVAGVPLTTTNP